MSSPKDLKIAAHVMEAETMHDVRGFEQCRRFFVARHD